MLAKMLSRTKWAIKAFSSPIPQEIEVVPGVVLDLHNKRIVITGDFSLHTEGNLRLTSDKHIILKSGQGEEERTGYLHSIWLNSEEDDKGRPLRADRCKDEDIDDGRLQHN